MQSSQNNTEAQAFLATTLHALQKAGLKRKLRDLEGAPGPRLTVDGRNVLLLCSNNYLGLATDERLKQAAHQAIEAFGCGATGSRLISGNLEPYRHLELELASLKGTEASLVFASGYQANTGTISALAGSRDAIFSDSLNHASLLDGCRLSRAETIFYNHCDVEDLERNLIAHPAARRKLILTESVFSMDGDLAPLKEIAFLANKYGAMLLVDEAHATGVFGPTGAGLVEALGLQQQVDIQMGTFSKALGSLGGYIAGSSDLISYLLHRARSFIFTTGLPPAVVAASAAALQIVRQEPQRRQALWNNVAHLQKGLEDLGFDLRPTQSQILPLRLGDAQRTMAACRFLLKQGVFVQGIRPPTVPLGTARLRVSLMATHSTDEIAEALAAFEKLQYALQTPKRLANRRPVTHLSASSF
ncbi:MAG: 8-amino-7-oxononanoate synthase [Acidobacteria bacterium]|nr:8-amino-7-oxononanoate synthase [Acidobacteriota bacterium]